MSIKCDVFTIQYSFYTLNACFFRTLAVIDAILSYIYHHQYSIAGCVLLRLKLDPDTDDCPQLIEEEGEISMTYRLRLLCRAIAAIILIVLLKVIVIVVFRVVFGYDIINNSAKSNSVKGTYLSSQNVT